MWTRKSWFLAIKVRLTGGKPRLRLGVWLALYVPYQWALSLEGLAAMVKAGGYDLGLAFDGDADRFLAVSEAGIPIDGDEDADVAQDAQEEQT